jgi:hypothetical protein
MPLLPDPYRVLGLTRGATIDEVRRAYRRLAKANHPDAAGPSALPRFLAIQAAYEQVAQSLGASTGSSRAGPAARRRASDADTGPATGRTARDRGTSGPTSGENRRSTNRGSGPATGRTGPARGARDAAGAAGEAGRPRGPRGKATLGSTSYDDADASPFEPDWGGASWYGTTSGTYWTINPKEYADPRKHGPEYQARARRSAGSPGRTAAGAQPGGQTGTANGETDPGDDPLDPAPDQRREQARRSTHTTSSWWDSTAGPADPDGEDNGPDDADGPYTADADEVPLTDAGSPTGDRRARYGPFGTDEPAPDPTRAAIDLGRALTDPRSGGVRGRLVRAVIGWLPIALGLGWTVGEVTGCGRFAASCDPAVGPLTVIGQGIILGALVLLPEVAAIAAGAALVLLAAATAASLILSATGAAADEASRRGALGALLVVAWLSGLAIASVRRVRMGPRRSRPVS